MDCLYLNSPSEWRPTLSEELLKNESESCSVMPNSLELHRLVLGILKVIILEWVGFPFFRGSSQPRDQIQVSHVAVGFFTSWATREAQEYWSGLTFYFSRGSSQPRNQTRVSCIADGFFTSWATREALSAAFFPPLSAQAETDLPVFPSGSGLSKILVSHGWMDGYGVSSPHLWSGSLAFSPTEALFKLSEHNWPPLSLHQLMH